MMYEISRNLSILRLSTIFTKIEISLCFNNEIISGIIVRGLIMTDLNSMKWGSKTSILRNH